jgi:N,N'-diacetyllegionaminate synthase
MGNKIKVGSKYIGREEPVYIIAEAGVNHNGDLRLAKQLVDAAKKSGVDAVKFQTYKTDDLVTSKAEMAAYQKKQLKDRTSQYELLKSLELDFDDFVELKDHCDKKRIQFLSTPHSPSAVDFLDPLLPVFKIASGDLTNLPFLELVASYDKPIIMSTGMGTLEEVEEAMSTIRNKGNNQIVLLHCVTNYPAPLETLNLRAMLTLKDAFGVPVGFSDHTIGLAASIAAVSLGACVIEKHFTLDKNLPGPDHKASLEPRELADLVRVLRSVKDALGDGIKKPTEPEMEIRKVARKSLVAKMDIQQGSTITEAMIEIKRPGIGIAPKHLKNIIGKKASRDIEKDELLAEAMFE